MGFSENVDSGSAGSGIPVSIQHLGDADAAGPATLRGSELPTV